MNYKGFTLLETLIYIALFGMMVTGVLSSVYAIGISAKVSAIHAAVSDEGLWLLETLKSGARSAPSTVFFLSSSTLMQTRNSTTEVVSGNDFVIEDFVWVENKATNTSPHSIYTSFALSARTSLPHSHTIKFENTIYPIP